MAGLCHLLRLEHGDLSGDESFLRLEQTVARLQTQNESLLQLTRIQDWKPRVQPTYLQLLVGNAIKNIDAGDTDVRLTDLDVAVNTDGQLLGIAIRNIVENGLLYGKSSFGSQLLIDSVGMPGHSKITISDNGVGIPPQELPHIFNMFHRASEKSNGSGMGLYVARKAVEKLDGEITVTSVVGEGSVFSIMLPLKSQDKEMLEWNGAYERLMAS